MEIKIRWFRDAKHCDVRFEGSHFAFEDECLDEDDRKELAQQLRDAAEELENG